MAKIGDNVLLERKNDVTIIFIRNNLSYQTADELREAEKKIQDDKILIDLGQVKLSTSRGMAALISIIFNAYDKNQRVALCNVSNMCMNIIDAMDLMKHMPKLKIFETLDGGLAHFRNI